MNEERTEGIVLRCLNYKDKERILTLFTPHFGLISLIVKNISMKSAHLLSLTTPFSQGEFIYKKGRSDLYRFQDGNVIHDNLALRSSLSHLQAAGSLAQAILSSQLPGKPASSLYFLFDSYLRQIPSFANPLTLLSSFYLKMLKYEGLLALQRQCARCPAANKATGLQNGESLCGTHASSKATFFSSLEWEILDLLQNSRSFESLKLIQLSPELELSIRKYFRENIR